MASPDEISTYFEGRELYAEYKMLASTGQLLDTLGVQRPKSADASARARFKVPPTPPAELMARRHAN